MTEGNYLRVQGIVRGPFTLAQLKTMRTRGQLQRFHEISTDRATWIPAGSVMELFPNSTTAAAPQTQEPPSPAAPVENSSPNPGSNQSVWPRYQRRHVMIVSGAVAGLALLVTGFFVAKNLFSKPAVVVPPPPGPTDTAKSTPELAGEAFDILKKNCYKCHGLDKQSQGANKKFDVLNRDILLAESARKPVIPYLTPGELEKSAIWTRIDAEEMPPDESLSAEQKTVLKKWILSGAEFPTVVAPPPPRTPVKNWQVTEKIAEVLNNMDVHERERTRFIVMHHLHNNSGVANTTLKIHRAGLSKLLNSLSKKFEIVPPKSVGLGDTVFQIDLFDYGWDAEKWDTLTAGYPYSFDEDKEKSRNAARVIRQQTGTKIYAVRADWFIANASKPPLYHDLLGIPSRLEVLERELLDVARLTQIRNLKVVRAGFQKSGVSAQNRVIERHSARHGYYWISYDFKEHKGEANARTDIMAFPLGPEDADLGLGKLVSFRHDGGEIIFALPNRLQGYMLIAADGVRIDKGPNDVVLDPKNSAKDGNLIVNGLSCFSCHKDGLIEKFDEVHKTLNVAGTAKEIVTKIYRPEKELEGFFKKDNRDFPAALEKCYKGFVTPDDVRDKEPIVFCHEEFVRDVNLRKAAHELEIDVEFLKSAVRASSNLRRDLGLEKDGTVSRVNWERVFPVAVEELALGAVNRSEPRKFSKDK